MIVTRLRAKAFGPWADLDVLLPSAGVVLIAGPVGSGKSSIPEAVAMAGWGESIRGGKGWQAKKKAGVGLLSPTAVIDRTRTAGGKVDLAWRLPAEEAARDYETASKAQEALSRLIGGWDEWLHSSAFLSRSASWFAECSPADRARLLERLLGVVALDAAAKLARDEQREAERAAERLATQAAADARVARSLRDQVAGLVKSEPSGPAPRPLSWFETVVSERETREAELVAKERTAATKASEIDAAREAAGLARSRLKVISTGNCPLTEATCPAADSVRLALEDRAREAAASLGALGESGLDEARKLRKQASALVEEARQELAERRGLAKAEAAAAAREAEAEAKAAKLSAELAELEARIEASAAEQARQTIRASLAQAAGTVLGVGGARAAIIAKAAEFVGGEASARLERILPRVRVSLPLSARGGQESSLGFAVEGLDDGYTGGSGGERRAVDYASIRAISALARASSGRAVGTTWWDEVFDALDPERIELVAADLQDLSEEAAVVVISHSPVVAEVLASVETWRTSRPDPTGPSSIRRHR